MLALCLMLSLTYYAQSYAGIIGWSLPVWPRDVKNTFLIFIKRLLRCLLLLPQQVKEEYHYLQPKVKK